MSLTQEEMKVLELLYEDARVTPERAAVMLGMREEDVRAAVDKLEQERVIVGYPTLVNWAKTATETV